MSVPILFLYGIELPIGNLNHGFAILDLSRHRAREQWVDSYLGKVI